MDDNQIKKWGESFTSMPSDEAWQKIENKLDNKTKSISINWKVYAIAANLLLVIAAIFGFNHYYAEHKVGAYSYNVNQKPIMMEDISNLNVDVIYFSTERIQDLAHAYHQISH